MLKNKKSEKKEEKQNPLISFMKKQIKGQNHQKNNKFFGDLKSAKNLENQTEQTGENKKETEEEKQEKLEEAKKESKGKAANYDQTRMMVKLVAEGFARYIFMILLLVGFAFLVIKAAPLIVAFFNGLISRIIFGAVKAG